MKTFAGSVAAGLLGGLLVYALVRWAWPGIAVQEFTNVIGLGACLGAAVGAVVVRRRRAAADPKQAGDAQGK